MMPVMAKWMQAQGSYIDLYSGQALSQASQMVFPRTTSCQSE
jgi:hypothetical protein